MHASNMRLLAAGVLLYLAWGNTFIVCVLLLLLAGWWRWASAGMSIRRKLQLATWNEPSEGCIYAKMSLDATNVLNYIEEQRKKSDQHITITHVIGKATALVLQQATGLNGRIVLDRFVPHKTVDISFLALIEGGKNLAKVKVTSADQKSVEQIAGELAKGSDTLRKGKDENFKKSMGPIRVLPTWLVRPVVSIAGYVASGLGLEIKALGVEPYPFGAALITSVGMLGVDEAYAPFTPFARVPLLLLIGAVREGVVVIDGQMHIRKKVKIMATLDHRFVDGAQGGIMAKVMRGVFADPHKYLGD